MDSVAKLVLEETTGIWKRKFLKSEIPKKLLIHLKETQTIKFQIQPPAPEHSKIYFFIYLTFARLTVFF